MKILKQKQSDPNRRLSTHFNLGKSVDVTRKSDPYQKREFYKTQHLYEQSDTNRPIPDSGAQSEQFMEFLNGYIKQLKTDPSVKASKIDQIMDRLEEERAFNKNILVMLKGIEKVVADRGSKLNKLAYAIEEIRNKENYCQNQAKRKSSQPKKKTEKYRIEDFLKLTSDDVGASEDSLMEYVERTLTQTDNGRGGRRKSAYVAQQSRTLPLQDLDRYISHSISMKKDKRKGYANN